MAATAIDMKCKSCGIVDEVLVPFGSVDVFRKCSSCGKPMRRVYGPTPFTFKGGKPSSAGGDSSKYLT